MGASILGSLERETNFHSQCGNAQCHDNFSTYTFGCLINAAQNHNVAWLVKKVTVNYI